MIFSPFIKICRNILFFKIIEGVVNALCTVYSMLIKINELLVSEISLKS